MKKISFLLAILLLASSFLMTACKQDKPKETTPAGTTPTATTPAATTPEVTTPSPEDIPVVHASITAEQLAKYEIIYAKGSSKEVKTELQAIPNIVFDAYDLVLNQRTDLFYEGVASLAKGQYEILIGETNREETATFLSDLKWDDYGYGMVGDKLVIAGKNEDGTLAALRAFLELLNKTQNSEIFFSNADQFIFRASYSFTNITVNGISAQELFIVCNEESLGGVAQILRDTIIDACGIAVPIITDAGVREGDKLLVIGKSAYIIEDAWADSITSNDYSIYTNQNLIWLNAKTTAGYLTAAAYIGADFRGKGGDTVVLKQKQYMGEDAIGVMSFNLKAEDKTSEYNNRIDAIVETILKYRPAVVGVQEATDMWIGLLNQKLGDIYTIVGDGRNADRGGEHSAILYLTDEFDCLDSGTKWLSETPDVAGSQHSSALSQYPRVMTYVHLSRKSDGKQFLHVNTHLDYGTSEAEETVKVAQMQILFEQIEKFADLPIIITGDFNATVDSPVYQMITDAGYKDSCNSILFKDYDPTYHALMGTTGEPSHIDFIFHRGMYYHIYYRICTERIDNENVSDHYPIFAILTFKQSGK